MSETEQTLFYHALDAWLAAQPADADAEPDAAATWQARYLELRDLVLLVEDLADDPGPATLAALLDAFRAFRNLVEGHTPRAWVVAVEEDGGSGAAGEVGTEEDASDVPF